MIRSLIHRFLLRRHFWRHATFSEVAELYASRMLRMLAINLSGAFLSVYLYQNGYSVFFIIGYWTVYYGLKVVLSLPSAAYAARFGPKHGILLANLLYIPALIAMTMIGQYGLVAIATAALLQALSVTLYNICHAVDFSKVKHFEHAGKEIAFMNIIEKITTGLSPLIGGFLAFWFGPVVAMLTAALVFGCAALPLLRTSEPTKSRQKLIFRDFPWRLTGRSLLAGTAVGFDVLTSGTVWLLFVAVIIIGIDGNSIYATLGILSSVVLLAALAASYVYGRLIDGRKGGDLLHYTVLVNAFIHASRPFVATPVIVAGVNAANEAATTGYTMAFTRGAFDLADSSKHRIAYLGLMETVGNIGATIGGAILLTLMIVFQYDAALSMKTFFFIAGAAVLLAATANFPLYRR